MRIPRVIKVIAKIISGFLLLILLVLFLIHTPIAQRWITQKVSRVLTETTNARVAIKKISFSLWGTVSVAGIEIEDPDGNLILSSDLVSVNADFLQLLAGNISADLVQLEGANGYLLESDNRLNIQFILDAFKTEKDSINESAKIFSLRVDQVNLQDIHFEFHSKTDSLDLVVDLGSFEAGALDLSINPNKITLNNSALKESEVSILISKKSQEKDTVQLPPLDFGSGFDFEINHLELEKNSLVFHKDQVIEKDYFDPGHLNLGDIQLEAANIVAKKDTLSLALRRLSMLLPGFPVFELEADASASPTNLGISNFAFSAGASIMDLDLMASFPDWSNLVSEWKETSLEISFGSSLAREQINYFLTDSILNHFGAWDKLNSNIEGRYDKGQVDIDTIHIVIDESALYAKGSINNIFEPDSAIWKDLAVNSDIGAKFNLLLTPYLGEIELPEELSVRLVTSGSINSFKLDSRIASAWGKVDVTGHIGLSGGSESLDLSINGDQVQAGQFLNLDWLGPSDFSFKTIGGLGRANKMELEGLIDNIVISETKINNIDINGSYFDPNAQLNITIADSGFNSNLQADVIIDKPLNINVNLQMEDFQLGKISNQDSTLLISSNIKSKIIIGTDSISGVLLGETISFESSDWGYSIDSLSVDLMTSSLESSLNFYSDDLVGEAKANFDFQDAPDLINNLMSKVGGISEGVELLKNNRSLSFGIEVENVAPLKLIDTRFEDITSIEVFGEYDETRDLVVVGAHTGRFNGFGIALDTLSVNFNFQKNDINSNLLVKNILYDSIPIGNLDFNILSEKTGFDTDFKLTLDSATILGIDAGMVKEDKGYNLKIDSIYSFNEIFSIDPKNSILIGPGSVEIKDLVISNDELEVLANGDLDNFHLSINRADLTYFNYLMTHDSLIISDGLFSGVLSYNKELGQFDLEAGIDQLTLMDTPPINILMQAHSDGENIPMIFKLNSSTNNIELEGNYSTHNSQLEALLQLDIDDLSTFQLLLKENLEEISGEVDGEINITGTLNQPKYHGSLRFQDAYLTTRRPRSTFQLRDEVITLDNSGIILNDFTVYDQSQNTLILNGVLKTADYKSFEYDFSLDTDNYILINNPRTEEYQLQGIFVLGSNLRVSGNENNTNVEAKLIVKDTTDLTYVIPQTNLELLTNEGIVEFIDPTQPTDSLQVTKTQSFYDSLVAAIPRFNLTSTLTLQDRALFRVLIDANSGDFIEVAGAADLELEIDRTGNVQLNGRYTVTKGFYQLYFYDLVKKRFDIRPGSSINWSGNPDNGALDFKAIHYIKTSSIGLIGHEIGENEKSIYRKPLTYEVGIEIQGTIERPEISFTLDLPREEKVNYPALESKLNRLKQPEFESELNKQVFGLLVLGGFLPESSGSDFDQSLVATTALSNSVNSILASQLNRFAGQFIQGVDINVGLQSYADYTGGGGGQTRTAMDFRVSKRLMDDRLSVEVGGDVDINADQSGARTGANNFRGDITVIYDLTESGSKKLKAFNNETYDIIYHEIRNTGISLIFIREFDKGEKRKK